MHSPLDAVLDAVGGEVAEDLIQHAVSNGGVFIQYGALSGRPLSSSVIVTCQDVSFSFLWLRNWIQSSDHQTIANGFSASFKGIRHGFFVVMLSLSIR
jgi:NADPH:quinone reductase-like Zn-dependent oxidoreductase